MVPAPPILLMPPFAETAPANAFVPKYMAIRPPAPLPALALPGVAPSAVTSPEPARAPAVSQMLPPAPPPPA